MPEAAETWSTTSQVPTVAGTNRRSCGPRLSGQRRDFSREGDGKPQYHERARPPRQPEPFDHPATEQEGALEGVDQSNEKAQENSIRTGKASKTSGSNIICYWGL